MIAFCLYSVFNSYCRRIVIDKYFFYALTTVVSEL